MLTVAKYCRDMPSAKKNKSRKQNNSPESGMRMVRNVRNENEITLGGADPPPWS